MSDINDPSANESEVESVVEEPEVANAKSIHYIADTQGLLESPIDLNISLMTKIELAPLLWYYQNFAPKKLKITNTGHTVVLSAKWHADRPYIAGGPLFGQYCFSQMHFHWGETSLVGSEHTADGCRMPLELHSVHYKHDYESHDIAMRYSDGIIILVYLYKLQNKPNPVFNDLLKALPQIQNAGYSTRVDTEQPLSGYLRPFREDYFLYWGSLITTSNLQRVLWFINREPCGIAADQIDKFRYLCNKYHKPLLNNWRPTANLEGRTVFHVNASGKSITTLIPLSTSFIPLTTNQLISEANKDNKSEELQL